jgi:hypothetical protein
MRNASVCALILVPIVLASADMFCQDPVASTRFSVLNFEQPNMTCRAKGRFQDKDYCDSKFIDQIVAAGKEAVPELIAQLTDMRRMKERIWDDWSYTTAGDFTFFLLNDLFTDSDWRTSTMPGLNALDLHCTVNEAAEPCWRRFLKTHTRTFIQQQWRVAWNANKDRVYWDEKARCFRLHPTAGK